MITAGTKSELDAGSPSDGPAVTATTWRVNSVDLLRGVVMVIMLLDHTREFVHRDVLNFEATDLTRTNVLLFFTRWITHFCAPIFVFLAGTGAFLQMARGKSKPELSRFLVKRGLWLILLELTLIRVVVWFNLDFHFALMLQVIWVIGVSMVALAALIHLPLRLIAIVSVALIALHNLLDVYRSFSMSDSGSSYMSWRRWPATWRGNPSGGSLWGRWSVPRRIPVISVFPSGWSMHVGFSACCFCILSAAGLLRLSAAVEIGGRVIYKGLPSTIIEPRLRTFTALRSGAGRGMYPR